MLEDIGKLTSGTSEVLLKMRRVQVDPGRRVLRQHSHTQFEIACIEHGNGSYTTANSIHPMEQGDMFVFASNESHCITEAGKDGLVLVNLHFEPRYLLEDHADAFSVSRAGLCFAHADSFENRIPSTRAQKMRNYFSVIASELSDRKTEYALSVCSTLNLLPIDLIRSHG